MSERTIKRIYKRERIRRKKQIIERILLTICLVTLLVIGSSAILTKANTADEAQKEKIYYKYFTEIEIKYGDSLWNIAGEYMQNGPYESRQDYIKEVAQINQLSGTKIIAEQNLIIPYYSEEYK